MRLNKNKIFGIAALILFLIGIAIILLGVYVYKEYTIVLTMVGVGFTAVAWTFNALKEETKWQFTKIIFNVRGVKPSKHKNPKDIYLSFFYGAKIAF